MFGNAEVWVVVVEWDSSMDLAIYTAPTIEDAQRTARQAVIDTFNETVEDYDPDGCRAFVLNDSARLEDDRLVIELTDEAWLEELHGTTTQPWVTIERHDVAINPVSR